MRESTRAPEVLTARNELVCGDPPPAASQAARERFPSGLSSLQSFGCDGWFRYDPRESQYDVGACGVMPSEIGILVASGRNRAARWIVHLSPQRRRWTRVVGKRRSESVLCTAYQRQSKRSPVRALFFMPSQRSPRYGHRSDTCHHEDCIMTDPTKVPNSPAPITCVAGVSLI